MSSGTQKNIFERRGKIFTFIIFVIIIILLDVICAITFNYIKGEPFSKFLYEEKRRRWIEDLTATEKSYRIPSEIYHHDLKIRASVSLKTTMWDNRQYNLFTDSLGFKSNSVKETSLVSDKYRILFIGDSFTEGVGMNFEDSFVGIVSDKLLLENIEVLNAGVATYSPMIYWRKTKHLIEELGLKFNELIVFIDMSDIYDEAYCYTSGEDETVIYLNEKVCLGQNEADLKQRGLQQADPQHGMKYFLKNNTIISYFFLNKLHDVLLQKEEHPVYDYENMPKYMIAGKRGMWSLDDKLYEEFGRRGLEKSRLYMEKLAELARKHNIKMTIAVYPWPAQIFHNDFDSRQVLFWKKFAAEENIGFINYFPCFLKLNKDRPLKTLDEYFLERDMHWNENGNRLIAETFLSYYSNKTNESFNYCHQGY
ncbi:MAG: hypothetical protein HY761_04760 [Candidatus Omnitrophica bacterium]|nr:hypothetical protein [Candidatus Omnitrophota bacterium]